MLNVELTLTIEDEQKIAYVRCAIGEESALVRTSNPTGL
jgi:hypothetical protein